MAKRRRSHTRLGAIPGGSTIRERDAQQARLADVTRIFLHRRGFASPSMDLHPDRMSVKLYRWTREGADRHCLTQLLRKTSGYVVIKPGSDRAERFRGPRNAARRAVELYAACLNRTGEGY